MTIRNLELSQLAGEILQAPKYKAMGIPEETVLDLLKQEAVRYPERRDLVKAVRRKLHNIMAPYLEELDYARASDWISSLTAASDDAALKGVCSRILESHASSKERMPFLDTFYEQISACIGKPASILDLACGFHPFSWPWMRLSTDCRFYAFDIHLPRIRLINQFFVTVGLAPLAELRDVLVSPPEQQADAAFIFKEAHRMEKRNPGCNRALWETLKVHYLLVSLPTTDLSGTHDLSEKHRTLVYNAIDGLPWVTKELIFPNEIVFVIDKGGAK